MTEARHGLYCNIVTVPTTQGAGRAWGAGLGVRRRRRGRPGQTRGARGRAGPGGAGWRAERRACGSQAYGQALSIGGRRGSA